MKKRRLSKRDRIIPIFFAADDQYVQFMMVTMKSIIENSSEKFLYRFHVLHTDITVESQADVKKLETDNCKVTFVDVSEELKKISKKIALRDYYSATTYFRIFIPDMFPMYKKVVYIDSDTVVRSDIAELYHYDLRSNYIGAIRDQLIVQVDTYGDYAEKVLGISRGAYFNAGVVLINCEEFRKKHMLKQFIDLLGTYTFVVAQDQDYLNILCKDHVLWLDPRWNVQMIGTLPFEEDRAKLVHYNLATKPWQKKDCRMGQYFWEYAPKTPRYERLLEIVNSYSEEDEKKMANANDNLYRLTISEIENEHNFYNTYGNNEPIKLTRIEVLKRIEELERAGIFDQDVEDDPEGRELWPAEVDYMRRSLNAKIRTRYAFKIARWFVNELQKKDQFVIKDIIGSENLRTVEGGAVLTCNHFNAFDSFAAQLAYESAKMKGHKLYRIISEANYTAFPGFYGFLMRNCNTLPLSSNKLTMIKFMRAVSKILQKKHYILIYPEQSMWWNYRKPKPLKKGGYSIAASNDVPVVPMFITMEDTDVMDADGFPVQAYTIHIGTPIYPPKDMKRAEKISYMMDKNFEFWKNTYETTYGIPLTYLCDENEDEAEESAEE